MAANEISPCSRRNAPLNGPFSIVILVYRRVVYSFLLNKVHKHDYLLNPTWPYCVAEVWLLKAEIKVLIFSCASSLAIAINCSHIFHPRSLKNTESRKVPNQCCPEWRRTAVHAQTFLSLEELHLKTSGRLAGAFWMAGPLPALKCRDMRAKMCCVFLLTTFFACLVTLTVLWRSLISLLLSVWPVSSNNFKHVWWQCWSCCKNIAKPNIRFECWAPNMS